MVKSYVSIMDVCKLLNELLALDFNCMQGLLLHRVRCNQAIADHSTVQVREYKGDEYPTVGMIGILNGFFGIRSDGFGAFCMEVDEEGKVLCVRPTPSFSPTRDVCDESGGESG